MMRLLPTGLLGAALVWFGTYSGLRAQDVAHPELTDPSRWPLEKVVLDDGQTLEGLIEREGEQISEFVEVRRPQGKPMYLLVRSLERRRIASTERLSGHERSTLIHHIEAFKTRTRFERGRLEDIELRSVDRDGVRYQLYGPSEWFTLQSTADAEMTRRCILRIEQVFAAYRRMLRPRKLKRKQEPPAFLLFGTTDQYRLYLSGRGLNLENPSFFAVEENLVVAGSNFSRFAQQLAQVRERHESLRKEQTALSERFPEELAKLSADLRSQGMPDDQRRRVLRAYRESHKAQADALELKIKSADRRNLAVFDDITARMFARLYHEAFHAYWENFLFPHLEYDAPRWLNEGLAQVFESGVLDGDVLRIDAPDRKRLQALQADLRSSQRLSLVALLTADERAFLVSHIDAADSSARHYLYSWGVAYYLMFGQSALNTESLERFVAPASEQTPIERFEELVGTNLLVFESEWRDAMLALTVE